MAHFSFNANDAPPPTSMSRGPLPEGKYEAIITQSDIKETKAGTGQYIELVIQITDGEFSGRRLWERLNVSNPNKKAEEMAKTALGALCVATNVLDMDDTEQLHDIPFLIQLEIDRKEPDRNRIVGYGAAKAVAPAAKPAAAVGGARPWAR